MAWLVIKGKQDAGLQTQTGWNSLKCTFTGAVRVAVCACVCVCDRQSTTAKGRLVNSCVCVLVMCLCQQFEGFLCVHVFASSLWVGSHCVPGELACARVYSKVDYIFGSILLTITKSFCFGENSTRKPMCSLSLCRDSASFTPITEQRKRLFLRCWEASQIDMTCRQALTKTH